MFEKIQMTTAKQKTRNSLKKRTTKRVASSADIKVFVRDFYIRYGKTMSKLSHE